VEALMRQPDFITFTGADDDTDIEEMLSLSRLYPIEWGILFSVDRQGTPRYPSYDWVAALQLHARADPAMRAARETQYPRGRQQRGHYLSAHVCGYLARAMAQDEPLPLLLTEVLGQFARMQVNLGAGKATAEVVTEVRHRAYGLAIGAILQCDEFPETNSPVEWLHDVSGGRGKLAAYWPAPSELLKKAEERVGYAGGLGPDNVAEAVEVIGKLADHYWLDMESGVRDLRDNFDLDKVEQVCRAVYG
jgi:hypothetical protein